MSTHRLVFVLSVLACTATLSSGFADDNDGAAPAAKEVRTIRNLVIDVLPGQPDNIVDPDSAEPLAVAILGSADFDPKSVNPATVSLGGAPVVKLAGGAASRLEDVDGDGTRDLIVFVDRRRLRWNAALTTLRLTAKTFDGVHVAGTNRVTTIESVRLGGRHDAVRLLGRHKHKPLEVTIDLLPGDPANLVDLDAPGAVPVAILSSAAFDATRVDPASLTLAGAQVTTAADGSLATERDVNGDGLTDLVVRFAKCFPGTSFDRGKVELAGITLDGRIVRGTDGIRPIVRRTVTYSSDGGGTAVQTRTFVAPDPIIIGDQEPAAPYPSVVGVQGLLGVISKMRVTLIDFQHSFQADVDILLVGPTGQSAILMSDAGGATASPTTLTFDAYAANEIPVPGWAAPGVYRPTDYDGGPDDAFPAPAPPADALGLSVFEGTDPNGPWALYVVDDEFGDIGVIERWQIEFVMAIEICNTAAIPIPDLDYASSAVAVPDVGGSVVSKVTATLNGLTHSYPYDLDILLESPDNAAMLLSDVGGMWPGMAGVSLKFDDDASDSIDAVPEIPAGGTYRPSNFDNGADFFPAAAPSPPYSTGMYAVNRSNPTGQWTLWVADDSAGDSGVIEAGWCVTLTLIPAAERTNPQTIAMPAGSGSVGAADPYPSTIVVDGEMGRIAGVAVALNGFTHTFPRDVDVMLVNPHGDTALVMSDAGGDVAVEDLTLVFDEAALNWAPELSLASGVYYPTDYTSGSADSFPAPAPAGVPTNSFFSFLSDDPNGPWSLWVVDDQSGDVGEIIRGWSLTLLLFAQSRGLSNTDGITIPALPNTFGAADPYPSEIEVVQNVRPVRDVQVWLSGLSHDYPSDLDIMLVGPQGQNITFMSDAGGTTAVSNANLTFSDDASQHVPDGAVSSGTYLPTDIADIDIDSFDPPAPLASGATGFGVFAGTDPNGTWQLYVMDDNASDTGSIMQWGLTLSPQFIVGEVRHLTFAEGKTWLEWSIAENASLYTVLRGEGGTLPDLITGQFESCHHSVVPHPFIDILDVPPPGVLFWYLVRGVSGAGGGPAGFWSDGNVERARLAEAPSDCPLASIEIETHTNSVDADEPPGPTILEGATVNWTYYVTNTGGQTLYDVTVTDDHGVTVSCPMTTMLPLDGMICTASGVALTGQYANVGSVVGQPAYDPPLSESDPSHYWGAVTK